MTEIAATIKHGQRVRSLPALYDLDFRRRSSTATRTISRSVLPAAPFESLCKTPQQLERDDPPLQRRLRRAVRQGERHFPGWVAQVALGAPDAGAAEAERAIKKRGARGADLTRTWAASRSTCRNSGRSGKDERARQSENLDPSGRAAPTPPTIRLVEKKSLYEIWWDARMVLRDRLRDDAPRLFQDHGPTTRTSDHHPPLRRHRGRCWRRLGPARRDGITRTSEGTYVGLRKSLKKARSTISSRTSGPTPRCSRPRRRPSAGLSSFPLEKIVFASDCPFDPRRHHVSAHDGCRSSIPLNIPKADREKIDYKNLEAVTGVKLVK